MRLLGIALQSFRIARRWQTRQSAYSLHLSTLSRLHNVRILRHCGSTRVYGSKTGNSKFYNSNSGKPLKRSVEESGKCNQNSASRTYNNSSNILPVLLINSNNCQNENSLKILLIPINIFEGDDKMSKQAVATISLLRENARQIEAFNEQLTQNHYTKSVSNRQILKDCEEVQHKEESNAQMSYSKSDDGTKLLNSQAVFDVIPWHDTNKHLLAYIPKDLKENLRDMSISSMQLAFEMDITNIKYAIETDVTTQDGNIHEPFINTKSIDDPTLSLITRVDLNPSEPVKTVPLNFNAIIQGTIEIDPSKFSPEQLIEIDVPQYNNNLTTIAANICNTALQRGFPSDISRMSYSTKSVSSTTSADGTNNGSSHIVCVREGEKGCISPGNAEYPNFVPHNLDKSSHSKSENFNKRTSKPEMTILSSSIIGECGTRGLMSCQAYAKALVEAARLREALKEMQAAKEECIPDPKTMRSLKAASIKTTSIAPPTENMINCTAEAANIQQADGGKKDPCGDKQPCGPKGGPPCRPAKKPCSKEKDDPCETIKIPCGNANPCDISTKRPKKKAMGEDIVEIKEPCKTLENVKMQNISKVDTCTESSMEAKRNKDDGCKKAPNPCPKKERKEDDACSKLRKEKDNCEPEKPKKEQCKKEDPCKQKSDPCKKDDPCKKKAADSDLSAKKVDPCKLEEKKVDKKKNDPCKSEKKKDDPCKSQKKKDPCKSEKKKEDPCKSEKKKEDPCKSEKKKEDPCESEKKKEDPCKPKTEKKKEDPCKSEKKKEDPCKSEKQKEDPCKKKDDGKSDSCKSGAKKNPCTSEKPKEEKGKSSKCNTEDPCKSMKKEKKSTDKKCASSSSTKPISRCGAIFQKASKTKGDSKKESGSSIPCGLKQPESKSDSKGGKSSSSEGGFKCPNTSAKTQRSTKPNCPAVKGKSGDGKKSSSDPCKKSYSTNGFLLRGEKELSNKRQYSTTVSIFLLKRLFRSNTIDPCRLFSSKKDDSAGKAISSSKCQRIKPKYPKNRKKRQDKPEVKDCFENDADPCQVKTCKDPAKTDCANYNKENKNSIEWKFSTRTQIASHDAQMSNPLIRTTCTSAIKKRTVSDNVNRRSECRNSGEVGRKILKNEVVKINDPCTVDKVHEDIPQFSDYAIALSGSDVHVYESGDKAYPGVTLGHDASGVIEKVGKCVFNLKPGDHVAIESGLSCGICDFCKHGTYNMCSQLIYNSFLSKYQVHPGDLCHKLPSALSLEEGALVQTVASGCQACFKAQITPTSKVLVIGSCSTAVAAALCARAIGAQQICISCCRLNTLKSIQNNYSFDCIHYKENTNICEVLQSILETYNGWPNVVINCAISELTMNLAVMALAPCGMCVLAECDVECASFNALDVLMKNLKLVPSFRSTNMFPTALYLMASGHAPVGPLVAKICSWQNLDYAFESALHESNISNKKVIVKCDDDEEKG